MKKVLLITLQGANIGNRLQNYALQTVLQKLGCEVYTPYYEIPECDTLKKKLKYNIKVGLGSIGVSKYRLQLIRFKRENKFRKFNKKYIVNRFKISFDKIKDSNWSAYDYAITGSDQVWHRWSENQNELKYFYLDFIPKRKRIAYAPSFGFVEFPKQDIEIHKLGIKGIYSLSCRERKGQELIKKLTKKDSELVLDPTLLLDIIDWKKIEKRPNYIIKEKYLLVYFLGSKTTEYQAILSTLAKDYKLKIIDILNEEYMEYYYTTPDEFIWLVNHAEFICTDSFHACVFSILFHKKFMAFKRMEIGMEYMFDRIETLLETFGLKDRIFSGVINQVDNNINYDIIDMIKKDLTKKSLHYLKNSLNKYNIF